MRFVFHRCAPCKVVAPKFAQLSEKHPAAVFLKVDVDICRVGEAKVFHITSSLMHFIGREQ